MTRFITGRACADISIKLREKLLADIRAGKKVTLIVPDQFEYETEKALYRACAEDGNTVLFTNGCHDGILNRMLCQDHHQFFYSKDFHQPYIVKIVPKITFLY